MGWGEGRASGGLIVRLAVLIATAALAAGCFQPLYGERSITGSPALRESLAAVDIQPIEVPTGGTDTRMAVQIRNDLIFNFTGGGAPYPPTHRLKIRLTGGRQTILVDRATALPTVEAYGLTAIYSLIEIGSGTITNRPSNSRRPCSMRERTASNPNGFLPSTPWVSRTAMHTCPTRLMPSAISALWPS